MALAVTAIMGRFLPAGSLRISFMVAMPSISGIMMSISTTWICGSLATRAIASRPLSAQTMSMPCSSSTVASAKMLRMSSSTISTRLPASGLVDSWMLLMSVRLASGRRARLLVQRQQRIVEQLGHRVGFLHRNGVVRVPGSLPAPCRRRGRGAAAAGRSGLRGERAAAFARGRRRGSRLPAPRSRSGFRPALPSACRRS